jgi:hypothetical protein
MGCVFFGQAHGELRLSDLIVSQSKGNRHAPLAESKSTVFRVQINLTSLCHRGIGRSIGDRSAVPARGSVKTALVIICDWFKRVSQFHRALFNLKHRFSVESRRRRWRANRRHCSTFLLATLNRRNWLNIRCLSACSFIGSAPTQNGRHKHSGIGFGVLAESMIIGAGGLFECRHSRLTSQVEEPKL